MLQIENLKKTYGDFNLDISMEIKEGTIVGIVGENGAGKSTFFKLLLGLIKKEEGKIVLNDMDLTNIKPKDKEQIGVVMADAFLSEIFTIKDIKSILKATYKDFDGKYFDEKCKAARLPDNKKLSEFSTGMKAKVKVISALSHKSKLLILDEPTQGLDVVARDEITAMVRDYMSEEEDRIVIISSHISSDIEKLCDRIYMISGGKIILNEDTDILLSDYAVVRADEEQYKSLDKEYVIATVKDKYSYNCLTDKKDFYTENYKDVVIEKITLDEMMIMMIKGDK